MPVSVKDIKPAPDRVFGYIDAVDAGRVFGWAWDPGSPSARLEIEARSGDRVVASALADKMRPDLVENQIGDGAHAFELPITLDGDGVTADNIKVFARSGAAEWVALGVRPNPGGTAGESPTLRRIAAALSAIGAAQRKMVHTTETKLAVIETSAAGDKTLAALEPVLTELRTAQEALQGRMAELDVFLIRFDATLHDLGKKISALQRESKMSTDRWWTIGGAAVALAAAAISIVALIS